MEAIMTENFVEVLLKNFIVNESPYHKEAEHIVSKS